MNYVAKAGFAFPGGPSATADVITSFIQMSYLWELVRVQVMRTFTNITSENRESVLAQGLALSRASLSDEIAPSGARAVHARGSASPFPARRYQSNQTACSSSLLTSDHFARTCVEYTNNWRRMPVSVFRLFARVQRESLQLESVLRSST